ncbi:hypothetical protein MTR67_039292 [Solanum verrucosum]|uniref:Uncharacterized protein n=1 Tax=Solanum verrucosum TaxID=315347 RepID=A0AAF0UGY3_SOLVR|nr:hypothetical protein MTR67_039292 [Solanum verrucosum]
MANQGLAAGLGTKAPIKVLIVLGKIIKVGKTVMVNGEIEKVSGIEDIVREWMRVTKSGRFIDNSNVVNEKLDDWLKLSLHIPIVVDDSVSGNKVCWEEEKDY